MMTSEMYISDLQEILQEKLKSVVLYGSTAAGDALPGVMNHNLLVVADPLGAGELRSIAAVTARWEKAGHPLPQFFTPTELASSVESFPIEILDMQRARKVLFGADLLQGLMIDSFHLRIQLEHDLRSKLLYFRQRFVSTCQDPQRLTGVLVGSISTFLVLFRAAITLYDEAVPERKQDALEKLATFIAFDPRPFQTVLQLKAQQKLPSGLDISSLAIEYLAAIELVTQAIEQHLHPPI